MASVIKEMPLSSDVGNYKFSINLLGTIYNIAVKYNYRMSRWFVDFRDVEDNAIVLGLPLLLGCDILQNYKSKAELPQGLFIAVNFKSQYTEITRDTLGVDGFLYFVYDDGT